jgi:hypothetical protein
VSCGCWETAIQRFHERMDVKLKIYDDDDDDDDDDEDDDDDDNIMSSRVQRNHG